MRRDQIDPFDEQFGDLNDFGQGAWSELTKGVAENLSRNVSPLLHSRVNTLLSTLSFHVLFDLH